MKFMFLACYFFIAADLLSAQDTTYFYASDFGITDKNESAKFCKVIEQSFAGREVINTYQKKQGEWVRIRKEKIIPKNDTLFIIKRKTDQVWSDRIRRSFHPPESGLYYFTERNGRNLMMAGTATSLLPLHLQDTVRMYYENQQVESIAFYDNNRMVSNQYWLPNGDKYYDNLHLFVDKVPEHNLGQTHFRAYMLQGITKTKYDLSQINDEVVIGWVVMKDGSTAGFHIISGVSSQLNKILIQLIKQMPGEWLPAELNGQPVRYYMKLPFNFSSESNRIDNLEIRSGVLFYD